ncbi:MAG: hypothetical protein EBX50_09305 [Chitinophagia bacterium]|nr:hypothetical protein [Chitinophagia bacterium]
MKTNLIENTLSRKENISTESTLTVETIAAARRETMQPSVFGIADLWKLERSRRARSTRKHFAY